MSVAGPLRRKKREDQAVRIGRAVKVSHLHPAVAEMALHCVCDKAGAVGNLGEREAGLIEPNHLVDYVWRW